MHRTLSILPLTLFFSWTGCLEEHDSYSVNQRPIVEISADGRILTAGDVVLIKPSAGISDAHQATEITLSNGGNGLLEVYDLRIAEDPNQVFGLTNLEEISSVSPALLPPQGPSGIPQLRVWLSIDPTRLTGDDTAVLEVMTNPDHLGKSVHRIPIVGEHPEANLSITPSLLDFGVVPAGESTVETLQLTNTGLAPLSIHSLSISGHTGFTFETGPEGLPIDGGSPALLVEPGKSKQLLLRFTSEGPAASEAALRVLSNSTLHPNGLDIQLRANTGGPCVAAEPAHVSFGGKLVGSMATAQVAITSCGDSPLVISKASLTADSAEAFNLATGQSSTFPITLAANESALLDITFVPTELATLDPAGNPVPVEAILTLETNTYAGEIEIPVSGYGIDTECPVPVLSVLEGEEVCPQTKLHLDGSQSYAPGGQITKYEWEVTQPDGSVSLFLPSASQPSPTFDANVAGSYTFRLRVADANGQTTGSSVCPDASRTVLVIPCEDIHVELLWHTPNDSDETDTGPEAGADLDLHFLHPFAQGYDIDNDGTPDGYFDNPFDTFWFNDNPMWGSKDSVEDDPSLDRDDTDGAGPENLNLSLPEDGLTYKVGVHYWNDHGFGPSDATVRIYLKSVLVFEQTLLDMIHCDLWEVATISWPSGVIQAITTLEGSPKVESFCAPPGWN